MCFIREFLTYIQVVKKFDVVQPSFGQEQRNVILGLTTNGFYPFSDKIHPQYVVGSSYSIQYAT